MSDKHTKPKKPIIRDISDEEWEKIEPDARKRDLREHRAMADTIPIETPDDNKPE